MKQKKPYVALALSACIPGVGQMYNGQVGKGISFLFGYIVSWLFAWTLIGIFVAAFFWLGAMADAYQQAQKINASEA